MKTSTNLREMEKLLINMDSVVHSIKAASFGIYLTDRMLDSCLSICGSKKWLYIGAADDCERISFLISIVGSDWE
jgi:hypothetical protein